MALEDWEHDSCGAEAIDAERFKNALFEMCDLWTDTTDPQEYVDFLDWLFGAMCEAMRQFPKLDGASAPELALPKASAKACCGCEARKKSLG